MKVRNITLILVILASTSVSAYDNEDTKFIPKNYSGKTLDNKSYQPKSYSSEKKVRATKYESSTNKRSFWNVFKRKEISEPKVLRDVKSNDDKMFSSERPSTEPVKRPEEKMLDDNAFESHTDEPETKKYVPDNRPRARDPLLAPRQGVKAPVK